MPSEPEDKRPPHSGTGPGQGTLEDILDRYLEELAAGRTPNQEAYLLAHPELADALRGVFKTLDFVEATSKSLNASRLERGQQLGEYRIIREVGRGGMGVVYEAIQSSLNRRVALKVLPAGALLAGHGTERFAREAATAGRLHHSNIVPVYAVGETDGIHYYAMQYIEGHTLGEHLRELRRAGTTPGKDWFTRVARWGQQVADALAYAHNEGIIHRDVKPSNLLLDARDNVWITDFGLARAGTHTTLTMSGDIIGTARYLSPEQARGGREQLDGRSDVYSLGATLYELLALTPAFDGDSRAEVLNRVAFADPTPLRRRDPAIPRDLETIVGKCMEKDRTRRYPAAADVAEDCRRFVAREPIRARRTPAVVKIARYVNRHRLQAAGVTVAVLLLVTTLGLLGRLRTLRAERLVEDAHAAVLLGHDEDRATRLLNEAAAAGIDSAELHLCRGLIPLLNRQPQRAIPPLLRAWQRSPESVEVGYALAYAYAATGDDVNGNRHLEQSAAREITTPLGWLLRGLMLAESQQDNALAAFNRALELRADFTPAIEARAHYRTARLLVEGARDELQPMLNDFDAWVTFWPQSDRSYSARATGWMFAAAYAATQPDLATHVPQWLANSRRDLDQALALQPARMINLARRGVYLRYTGEFRAAADAFAEAIAADRAAAGDDHPGLVHHRALALHAAGDMTTAFDEITEVYAELPSFFILSLHRALLLAELGRREDGLQVAREQAAVRRRDPTAVMFIAAFLELLGDPSAATQHAAELHAEQVTALPEPAPQDAMLAQAVAFMAGEVDSDTLLASAANHPGRRCQCTFLIGVRALGRGDRPAARAALQACLDTHVFTYLQHRFAQVFLARMNADPRWPAWLPPAEPAAQPASPEH